MSDDENDSLALGRRDWVALLGSAGALFGASALAGCATPASLPVLQGDGSVGPSVDALSAAGLEYVETMAQLRSFGAPLFVAPPTMVLLGYYAPGDGGGGLFVWQPSATEEDDGGLWIQPSW